MRAVRLEIGELALHGFRGLDGERVRAAAVRELGRLIGEGAAWPRSGVGSTSLEGTVSLRRGASAEEVGAAVGRAVHTELAP